jgi:peptidoglycan hydrolase-like protein with peptidoglycan-binding domain
MQQLLDKIAYLKSEIARLQGNNNSGDQITCSQLNNNLSFGMLNNAEVKCLQKFLKSQGSDIYPGGYVTGNFLGLTRTAVIKFQEKYASEILVPLGLQSGTGFVGPSTRIKINQILSQA